MEEPCPCEILYAKPMKGYYPLAPDHDATKVGSIAYFDGREIKFVAKDDWNRRLGTPIGVLVIPASHMPDGKCRVMSLCNMSYLTPETGSLAYGDDASSAGVDVQWGPYSTYTPLTAYSKVQGYEEGLLIDYGDISSDLIKRNDCVECGGDYYKVGKVYDEVDTKAAWLDEFNGTTNDYFAVSPYLSDGSQNPLYVTTGQVLSDMDGSANTATLVDGGYYTSHSASYACRQFRTSGTRARDWYLPSAGELGYVAARLGTINDTLIALGPSNAVRIGDTFDNSCSQDFAPYGEWIWCSSRKTNYYAWGMGNGRTIGFSVNDNDYGVTRARAFIALGDGSTNETEYPEPIGPVTEVN